MNFSLRGWLEYAHGCQSYCWGCGRLEYALGTPIVLQVIRLVSRISSGSEQLAGRRISRTERWSPNPRYERYLIVPEAEILDGLGVNSRACILPTDTGVSPLDNHPYRSPNCGSIQQSWPSLQTDLLRLDGVAESGKWS